MSGSFFVAEADLLASVDKGIQLLDCVSGDAENSGAERPNEDAGG